MLSGRYKKIRELAVRSGSSVYLVRHTRLGEYRTVKVISKQPEFSWQIREAEILSHLKHPDIPRLYDVEEDEESFYMIEEYAAGESLEAVMLQSSLLTLNFIYDTIMEVADLIRFLHQQMPHPLIYQDLKAEHVILCPDVIKLIDFGIAVFLGEDENKVQNYGTPEYSPPEKRTAAKAGTGTDIYGLGRLLQEMIEASGTKESQSLLTVAHKAMHPEETCSYHSVAAFQQALQCCVQSQKQSVGQNGHLLKTIIVAGSQTHIGTTHVSAALTCYLNHRNRDAVYLEHNSTESMRASFQMDAFAEDGGLYRRGKFKGIPRTGDGVWVRSEKHAIRVMDYGNDLDGALKQASDLFILVVGSRFWEIAAAKAAYEQAAGRKGLILLANYGNLIQAGRFAGMYERPVYSFPLDADPFLVTPEKERLFDGLLMEREDNDRRTHKSSWYFRKCRRLRRYLPVLCTGKLLDRLARRKNRLR